MSHLIPVKLTVNGDVIEKLVEPNQHLTDFLRTELGLTGSHLGCEHGVCGACSVRVNGLVIRGCLMFASQIDGAIIDTIEGVVESGEAERLIEVFVERNALQCGFCTPGIVLTAIEILNENKSLSRSKIREELSGNICRCTGYQAIIDAVESIFFERSEGGLIK
ncbi:MAG: (2Fe-2S)-binding protein [Pseudomonadota bacterium]|nr:(2Fe-2S)-binding protein [Pseudomonadota bacterium]